MISSYTDLYEEGAPYKIEKFNYKNKSLIL